MEGPISPPAVAGSAGTALPAYMSNGVIGLRVRDNPLTPGMALVSGFSGEHPERKIEAAALAPYPLAGDICMEGVWMSDVPQSVRIVDQAYDFSTAELTTRLNFKAGGRQATLVVTSFCSREQPTVVCQEVAIDVDAEFGITDEYEPWLVFCDDEGQVIVHFARLGQTYVACVPFGDEGTIGNVLSEVVRTFLERLAMPNRDLTRPVNDVWLGNSGFG